MQQRLKQAVNIEDALGVLLEASNAERRVRSRARLASTLEEALDSLFSCDSASGDENGSGLNFDEFEDGQLFSMPEGANKERETTRTEAKQQRPRTKVSDTKGGHLGLEDDSGSSTESETEKDVRELNGEPKFRKKRKTQHDRTSFEESSTHTKK